MSELEPRTMCTPFPHSLTPSLLHLLCVTTLTHCLPLTPSLPHSLTSRSSSKHRPINTYYHFNHTREQQHKSAQTTKHIKTLTTQKQPNTVTCFTHQNTSWDTSFRHVTNKLSTNLTIRCPSDYLTDYHQGQRNTHFILFI